MEEVQALENETKVSM